MLNYWWATRPKRKLNDVPETLVAITDYSLDQEWQGQRSLHLALESALECEGVKRSGSRRDQTGGGARTYLAWISSLGLIFTQEYTNKIQLTLAGEAIMAGESPVHILKNQILKYQFPSAYSLKVNMADRFKIRPFRFLLRLMNDPRIKYLTTKEIGRVVIVEAENESEQCYNYIVRRILEYREAGEACLSRDFFTLYKSSKGPVNPAHPYSHLDDVANTFLNWLEYTQLVLREKGVNSRVSILPDMQIEVDDILSTSPPFIDRPEEHEYFQRKFGLDPNHRKDTRNLTASKAITEQVVRDKKIQNAYISEALINPITEITSHVIEKIADKTGYQFGMVEDTLHRLYPRGSIGAFLSNYFEMAFQGRENATEFEIATAKLFKNVFGFESQHIGPIGKNPDVLLLSDTDKYIGIIDNKAYSEYSITNDHRNRMVHNYIKQYNTDQKYPLCFFNYIAGGFGTNINSQIKGIVEETNVHGSAISVSNVIKMVENYNVSKYSHSNIKDLFSVDRKIGISDLGL